MDLEKAINSSKSSTKIYRSLSHYLYNKLLQAHDYTETFDVLNWWSWLSIFGMIAGFLALIGVGFLHFGTILLAVAYNAPRARALPTLPQSFDFGLQTTPITGANTYVFPDLRQIAELLPADITLLWILILLILAMVFYGILKRRKLANTRTLVMLQVADGNKSFTTKFITLEFPPVFYKFEVQQFMFVDDLKQKLCYSSSYLARA